MGVGHTVALLWRRLRLHAGRSEPSGFKFKAFISYKHSVAPQFAAQLESALKRYAKPLLARPIAVFRDEKHLVPAANLPKLIADALDASEFLILLASPQAAQSVWVRDELDRWCRVLGRVHKLIVVLIAGHIEVVPGTKSIDWSLTDALPDTLRDSLPVVPLYLDLRDLVKESALTLEEPAFKSAVNKIVARFRNVDPNEMLGEEILQHRRNLRLRTAAVMGLTALTLVSMTASYLAFRQAESANRERNNALNSESRLLAAESVRSGGEGRYVEAIELALRAFPDDKLPDPRPYSPEAEAALVSAVLDSPLRHRSRRLQSDLAAMFLDDAGSSVLSLSYDDELTLTDERTNAHRRIPAHAITSYQQEVDCRTIVHRVVACMRYHGGSMSGGCDGEIYPGHRQVELFRGCLAREENGHAEAFVRSGAAADRAQLTSLIEEFETLPIVNTKVDVRLSSSEVRRRVVPNFAANVVALHSMDRERVEVLDLSTGALRAELRSGQTLIRMTWLMSRYLLVAFEKHIEVLDVETLRRSSFEIEPFSIFVPGVPVQERDVWVGVTKTGQPIRWRSEQADLQVEGAPVARVVRAEALSDASGFTWIAERASKSRNGDQAEVAVYLANADDHSRTRVAATFTEIISVAALDDERLAVIGDGRLVVADRRSGELVGQRPLPLNDVYRAWLLDVGTFYRTAMPTIFREAPTEDPQFLLLTNHGAGTEGAYIFGAGSNELRQLALADARVEGVIESPASIILFTDNKLSETGFTGAILVPRKSDPEVLSIAGPPEVGGVFDFAGADPSGLHLALSENQEYVSVYSVVPTEPTTYCEDVSDEHKQFFHIARIGSDRLIGVGERGLCYIDLNGGSRTVPTEFYIDEFLYSAQWKLAIAGHDGWGLYLLADDGRSIRQLESSEREIDALALSHDQRFLFAIIDDTLRVWSLPAGKLVFSSSEDWRAPAVAVDGLAVEALGALALEDCATFVVSNSLPLIAVSTLRDGNGDRVRLIRYDTGEVTDFPFERAFDGLAFSPDGGHLAILEVESLRMVDGRSGTVEFESDGGNVEELAQLAYDSSGKYLMAVPNRDIGQDHPDIVRVWPLRGDRKSRALRLDDGAKDARFSDDGEFVLVAGDDGHVALFDSGTGKRIRSYDQHDYIAELTMFAEKDRLAVAMDTIEGKIRLIDRATGIRLTELSASVGSSVNNAFGRLEPLAVVSERNTLFVASRTSGIVAMPFYFDYRKLRQLGEARVRMDQ